MKILADENILFVREAFSGLGAVRTLPGRAIGASEVAEAEVLLVRTVTPLNESLFGSKSPVFVGSASSGIDHVDGDCLSRRGIPFAHAPGSNARSVAEYVLSALVHLAHARDFVLREKRLGIVGAGHVGGHVREMATSLGMECVLNDPPLARETGDPIYRPIEDIYDCDIVTFHVPLVGMGVDRTQHQVDRSFIERMRPGFILFNTSRGPVVDSEALLHGLETGIVGGCVLDVWEHEPEIHPGLLEAGDIVTSHIAGYSFDGKLKGTLQIRAALVKSLGLECAWDPGPLLPPPDMPTLDLEPTEADPVHAVVSAVYDIRQEDRCMRALLTLPEAGRAMEFDRLRRDYRRRREFSNTTVRLFSEQSFLRETFLGLGFQVKLVEEEPSR